MQLSFIYLIVVALIIEPEESSARKNLISDTADLILYNQPLLMYLRVFDCLILPSLFIMQGDKLISPIFLKPIDSFSSGYSRRA